MILIVLSARYNLFTPPPGRRTRYLVAPSGSSRHLPPLPRSSRFRQVVNHSPHPRNRPISRSRLRTHRDSLPPRTQSPIYLEPVGQRLLRSFLIRSGETVPTLQRARAFPHLGSFPAHHHIFPLALQGPRRSCPRAHQASAHLGAPCLASETWAFSSPQIPPTTPSPHRPVWPVPSSARRPCPAMPSDRQNIFHQI